MAVFWHKVCKVDLSHRYVREVHIMKFLLRGLVTLICLISMSTNLYAADRSHQEELWDTVGIKTGFITTAVLNPQICYASGANLDGCVRAIDSILYESDSKDSTLFTTSDWLENLNKFSAEDNLGVTYVILKDFGFYKIVKAVSAKQTQKDDKDVIAEIMKSRDREKQEIAYWETQVLAATTRNPIPFDGIIAWAKQNRITAANESMVAGEALNAYITNAVDAHGYVLPRKMIDEMSKGTSDDYSGIGVSIRALGGKIIIPQPFEGGPAYKVGIRSNDVILAVNGKDVTGETTEQVADVVQGSSGTPVTLKIQRKTQELDVTIIRAKIHQENVTWQTDLQVQDSKTSKIHHVGYIKIRSFMTDGLCATVTNGLNAIQSQPQKVEAIILDLRDNPGGHLDDAACIAGLFVGRGKLVVEQRSLGKEFPPSQEIKSTADQIVKVPVVTLVNANSASASEILSGDLQDYRVGPIVGARTWGKATVQDTGPWFLFPYTYVDRNLIPNTYVAKTIARFYLPGNEARPRHTNQIVGIVPDVEAYEVPNPTDMDKFAYREADMSPIVLSQQDMDYNPPYPTLTSYYETCLKEHGEAEKVYASKLNDQVGPDYQKLVGLDAALCATLKGPAQPAIKLSIAGR